MPGLCEEGRQPVRSNFRKRPQATIVDQVVQRGEGQRVGIIRLRLDISSGDLVAATYDGYRARKPIEYFVFVT